MDFGKTLVETANLLKYIFGPGTTQVQIFRLGENLEPCWGDGDFRWPDHVSPESILARCLEAGEQQRGTETRAASVDLGHHLYTHYRGILFRAERGEQSHVILAYSQIPFLDENSRFLYHIFFTALFDTLNTRITLSQKELFFNDIPLMQQHYALKRYIEILATLSLQDASSQAVAYDILYAIKAIAHMKIENEPVKCGFLFVQDLKRFQARHEEAKYIFFRDSYPLHEVIDSRHELLQVIDGRDGFLLVHGGHIRGLFLPFYPVKGLYSTFLNTYKTTDLAEDVFLCAIDGGDEATVMQGERVILEFRYGKPFIRDHEYFHDHFTAELGKHVHSHNDRLLAKMAELIFEISRHKKGSIIVFGPVSDSFPIYKCFALDRFALSGDDIESRAFEKELISIASLSHTDGGIWIDENFNVLKFGCIFDPGTASRQTAPPLMSGHSREYTAQRLSETDKNLLVVKISEDGPIKIFKGGSVILVA